MNRMELAWSFDGEYVLLGIQYGRAAFTAASITSLSFVGTET